MKIFILILVLAAIPGADAQVASPNINVLFSNINPAVVAFNPSERKISFGGTLAEGEIAKSVSGRSTETRDVSSASVIGNINLGNFGSEVFSLLNREEKITDKGINAATFTSTQESSGYQLNLGYRFFSWLSLGAAANKEEKKILDDKAETTQYGAGLNLYFSDLLHLGISSFMVNNKSTYVTENSWMQSMIGAALSQHDSSWMWKVEASYSISPQSIAVGDSSGLANNYHRKTTGLSLGGECLLFGNILTRLFMSGLSGVNFGISKTIETKEGLTATSSSGTSSSSGPEETTDTIAGHLLLVIMNKKIEIGPSLMQKKSTQGENQVTEDIISISAGFKI